MLTRRSMFGLPAAVGGAVVGGAASAATPAKSEVERIAAAFNVRPETLPAGDPWAVLRSALDGRYFVLAYLQVIEGLDPVVLMKSRLSPEHRAELERQDERMRRCLAEVASEGRRE